jgi:excinuclease ABC subunit C
MCFDRTAKEQFRSIMKKIIFLFEGSDRSVLEEMKQKMKIASDQYDFEAAAKIRNDLEWINSLLKKEKVIEFTEENKNIVIIEPIEPISEKVLKLFLIKGSKVLFSQKAEWTESLHEWIKSKVLECFKKESHLSTIEIGKDRIDEAQIVYSYLKSASCKYVEIPEKWLLTENQNKIDRALYNLL